MTTRSPERKLGLNGLTLLREGLEGYIRARNNADAGMAIVQLATGVELVIKSELKKISPALIIADPDCMASTSEIMNLGTQLKVPDAFRDAKVKVVSFEKALIRLRSFRSIPDSQVQYLRTLYQIRSGLLHFYTAASAPELDDLVLIELTKFLKGFLSETQAAIVFSRKIQPELDRLGRKVLDQAVRALQKRLASSRLGFMELSQEIKEFRQKSQYRVNPDEQVTVTGMGCPACGLLSLALVEGVDVDYEDGEPVGFPYKYFGCGACDISLTEDEIKRVAKNPEIAIESLSKDAPFQWNFALLDDGVPSEEYEGEVEVDA